ncbi:Uncharacterised protein [Corynebacterium renale]|uniref:Uncharacterized protein n=1 Tax=Corynebacterium renale TaxID=1724 RepID=A0A2A9DQ50_9CORY|nr:hypothetical protein ATK06_1123 [Corynebacterium renale]SQG65373.1 Uncharacterised protein [Corynebacterium renale]SQI21168.1 Uncharacterised protein [Corynebacterium renale]STC99041.1 Uncharacterised protein [Corynebacterium renale]
MIWAYQQTLRTAIAAIIFLLFFTPSANALGKSDPLYRDNIGTYTVKCQVHKNAPGNPVVGIVIGSHSSDPHAAESDANLFVSKFGPHHSKRHCKTQRKYLPRGAYTTAMNPI